jgi:hypothetical protein
MYSFSSLRAKPPTKSNSDSRSSISVSLSVHVNMVVMVMRMLPIDRTDQASLLPKLTTGLMSPEIIQPWKAALTAHAVEFTQHMLMLGPVGSHVAFEIGPFAVQILPADMAVHFIAVVAACDVVVTHLLVHERLGTSGERAFEGAAVIGLASPNSNPGCLVILVIAVTVTVAAVGNG